MTAPNFEAPTDVGGNNVYDITVTATENGSGSLSATKAVAITVTNVNEAPVITSAATASFAENGTGTVYTATATDVDAGTTLSYTLGGTDSALFNINAGTGAVTFKATPDYEAPSDSGANNVYDITVTASDGSLTGTRAVAITVTNVNEAPAMASGQMTTSVFEVADAPYAFNTPYTLLPGQTVQGTLVGVGDQDLYKVHLEVGQQYSFAMIGTGVNNIQDPSFRLYDSSAQLVTTANYNILSTDVLNGGSGFYSVYTAAASGDYYIAAGASVSSHTGQYGIAFNLGAPRLDASMGAGAIDSDCAWSSGGSAVTVTYGFRATGSGSFPGFQRCSDAEISAIKVALQFWQDLCGITFSLVQTSGQYTDSAAMLFGDSTSQGSFAYLDAAGTILSGASSSIFGDVVFRITNGSISNDGSLAFGGYAFATMVHEIGHAIGLSRGCPARS